MGEASSEGLGRLIGGHPYEVGGQRFAFLHVALRPVLRHVDQDVGRWEVVVARKARVAHRLLVSLDGTRCLDDHELRNPELLLETAPDRFVKPLSRQHLLGRVDLALLRSAALATVTEHLLDLAKVHATLGSIREDPHAHHAGHTREATIANFEPALLGLQLLQEVFQALGLADAVQRDVHAIRGE